MMDQRATNGDTRLILHRLDQVSDQVKEVKTNLNEVKTKQEGFHEANLKSRAEIEKQTALLQQSQEQICNDVDDLQGKSNRNDALVVVGNVIVVAAATIANALGIRDQ